MKKTIKLQITGIKGETGEQGIQGIQGVHGEKGERGEQGIQGIQGMKGERGDKGEKGDKGDIGERGEQGVKGDKGEPGKDVDTNKIKDIEEMAQKAFQKSSKTVSLVELDDVNLDGLTKTDGKYNLGSGSTSTPTLQQVTDVGATTTNDIIVPDEVYGAGWNGSLEVPTKNALYDKIETLGSGASIGGAMTSGTAGSVLFVDPNAIIAQNNQNLFWDNALKNLLISSTLGSELLTNGTFTGNATGWTVPFGWAYSANTVVHSSNGTGALQPSTALTTVIVGFEYQYSIDISSMTVGTATLAVGGVTLAITANGTYTKKFVATSNANLTITPTSTARFTVDNISLKRLSGGAIYAGSHVGDTHTAVKSALGTTTSAGFIAENTTLATSGVQQASPSYLRKGQGFLSNTSASFPFEVQDYVIGNVNNNPYGKWFMQSRANSGSWNTMFSYDTAAGGLGFSIYTPQAQSNSTPGTTRAVSINNTGGNSWLDFNFSGTRKSSLGADSSGVMYVDTTGSNGMIVSISGIPYHYLTSNGLYTSGYGMFSNGVNAGSTVPPTSMLQSQGRVAFKVKRITSSQTLDNSAAKWLLDGTTAYACSGNPTYQCYQYTNEIDCIANGSHGGKCNWYAGESCSVYNGEYNMYSCASQTGCTVDTASCNSATDSASCYAQNDAYGGTCSWVSNENDCSVFGDQSSCEAVSCYWDGSTCSGTYTTYSCDGTYNTGNCSGNYGASCSGGDVTCTQYDNSTSCSAEAGCSGTSAIVANLPNITTCPDADYWLLNDSSTSADAIILPYGTDTVNSNTSYTLANYKDGIHISPLSRFDDCAIYNSNESTCNSTSGCTANYANCSWDGSTCSGVTGCESYGDETSCTSASIYTSCSGSFLVSRNWYIWSRT